MRTRWWWCCGVMSSITADTDSHWRLLFSDGMNHKGNGVALMKEFRYQLANVQGTGCFRLTMTWSSSWWNWIVSALQGPAVVNLAQITCLTRGRDCGWRMAERASSDLLAKRQQGNASTSQSCWRSFMPDTKTFPGERRLLPFRLYPSSAARPGNDQNRVWL